MTNEKYYALEIAIKYGIEVNLVSFDIEKHPDLGCDYEVHYKNPSI